MARLSLNEKRAVQSQKLAAVIAADPRLRANDAARRSRDDAEMLAIKSRSKRAADAKARAKASMTDAERERVRMKARREREADKRRAVRDAAAEKLKADKAAAREVAKKAAALAKRSALDVAWWRAEAKAAVARGEPFADKEAQKVYMEAKRSADARAAKALREAGPAPALMTDEMAEWDGEVPW